MQSTITPKEHTTNATATHKLIRLAPIAALAAALAATSGALSWSDETLKQDIQPTTDSLNKLRSFKTQALRVAAVAAPAAALAASSGFLGWSDETLKQDIRSLHRPLSRLSQLSRPRLLPGTSAKATTSYRQVGAIPVRVESQTAGRVWR